MQSINVDLDAPFKDKVKKYLLYPLPERLIQKGYGDYEFSFVREPSVYKIDSNCFNIEFYFMYLFKEERVKSVFYKEFPNGTLLFKDVDLALVKMFKEEPVVKTIKTKSPMWSLSSLWEDEVPTEAVDRVEVQEAPELSLPRWGELPNYPVDRDIEVRQVTTSLRDLSNRGTYTSRIEVPTYSTQRRNYETRNSAIQSSYHLEPSDFNPFMSSPCAEVSRSVDMGEYGLGNGLRGWTSTQLEDDRPESQEGESIRRVRNDYSPEF